MKGQWEVLPGDKRDLSRNIQEAERLLGNARADLSRREREGVLGTQQVAFGDLDILAEDDAVMVDNFVDRRQQLKDGLAEGLKPLRKVRDESASELFTAMSRFLQQFSGESDLDACVETLSSFLGLRQRIIDDDLPRHERRFKERLNEKVVHEIAVFRGGLETERRAIQNKIETLNLSLRKLEYPPGRHIQLEAKGVRDPEVVDFQRRLRECLEESFEESPEINEARFLRIKDLVTRLQDEVNRRWRDKVTDVRRWFDFAAAVIDRRTNQKESVYQDSDGQSGGEKAKLAFTILVAAVAYQYDLDLDATGPAKDRLHLVVVDEMLAKADDQHARYALDLFQQFGLQLLIVAPLDAKARVTQPYIGCYLLADKKDNRSRIFEMSAETFEEKVATAVEEPVVERMRVPK